jgi:hypothetical protein
MTGKIFDAALTVFSFRHHHATTDCSDLSTIYTTAATDECVSPSSLLLWVDDCLLNEASLTKLSFSKMCTSML